MSKFSDYKIYFINPLGKYKNRYDYMYSFLKSLGVKEGNIIHYKSKITNDYTNELKRVVVDILSENLDDTPVIILEDDIRLHQHYVDKELIINLPKDTDAFYLGFHKWGIYNYNIPDQRYRKSWIKKVDNGNDNLYNIFTMLGAHAIIYCSKKFKERVINDCQNSLEKGDNIPNDCVLAMLLDKYKVYGNRFPMFYQCNDWKLYFIDQ